MTEQINTNKKPKVSIGMPVYNGEKYIREALDSLLAQTFTDFELIISDNCSTDNTDSICKEYALKDSRIKYIRQLKNIGPTANFKFVLQKAKADYFMWAAHDDRWRSNFLEKLSSILSNDSACGLAFSNYIVRDLETESELFYKVSASDTDSKTYNFLLRVLNVCPSLIYGLFKRSLIINNKFETFDFSDVHFISQLSLKAKIKIVDDYLYIAGTKGDRVPYSLNGKRINRGPFLKKQLELLKGHFLFPLNYFLFSIVCVFMFYNKVKLWRY